MKHEAQMFTSGKKSKCRACFVLSCPTNAPLKRDHSVAFLHRCIAYVQGRYKGWKAEKLEGRSFDKSRMDLLLCGDLE